MFINSHLQVSIFSRKKRKLLFTALWAANSKGFTSLRALPSVAHSAPCKVFFLTHMSSEKTDLSSFAPAGAKEIRGESNRSGGKFSVREYSTDSDIVQPLKTHRDKNSQRQDLSTISPEFPSDINIPSHSGEKALVHQQVTGGKAHHSMTAATPIITLISHFFKFLPPDPILCAAAQQGARHTRFHISMTLATASMDKFSHSYD